MNKQEFTTGRVIIHDDVWIGHGVTILKSVTIGTGVVVAAGAVISKKNEGTCTILLPQLM